MNEPQLKKLIGRRIVSISLAADKDQTPQFEAVLDDKSRLQVLFFEEHGGTVKVVEK